MRIQPIGTPEVVQECLAVVAVTNGSNDGRGRDASHPAVNLTATASQLNVLAHPGGIARRYLRSISARLFDTSESAAASCSAARLDLAIRGAAAMCLA